ncbi:hypothetical protein [Acinetobacter seifertii]|uniref:hypothetical protein n=1 Tax=Acinetobacter seifertii TaxID=1530123 RepID=UPI00083B9501|nr:hypothetical protein [Acinetobacter seifertii]OCZ58444.1 hypothetical protein A7P21_15245 [Acinetobacter seifertii]
MSSSIFEIIPGVHATIVSIFAAFYSAYFIYAYQKVTDSKRKLDKCLNLSKIISIPDMFKHNGEPALLKENGELDWDKYKILIQQASSLGQNLKSGNFDLNDRNLAKELVDIVDKTTQFFHYFFTTYPMNGDFIELKNTNINKIKNLDFDAKRYNEIDRRLQFLSWKWENSKEEFLQLFRIYDFFKKTHEDFVKDNIRDNFFRFDSTPILINFFERVEFYKKEVLPVLNETLSEYNTFNDELKIKSTTKSIIYLTLYILLIGIITPLGILKLQYCNFIKDYFNKIEFGILLISFLPYILVCFYFLRRIKKSFFK